MYYVDCKGCGRPVMVYNQCVHCLTQDRSEVRKPRTDPASTPMSPGSLALIAGVLVAAGIYLQTANEFTAAAGGVCGWLFARTSIGQALVKVMLAVVGLGLAWVVWTFFNELSKTYR